MEPLDGKRYLFFEPIKIVGLAEHGPDSAHLKHQPLDDRIALAQIRRPELPRFFRQIHQDRARFEKREGLAAWTVGIDDRWNFIVRIDRKIFRFELIPLDRKTTRLNSSHMSISYAVFCL